jgi:hypothetical protein
LSAPYGLRLLLPVPGPLAGGPSIGEVTTPQAQLLDVLHQALARTGQDLDLLVQRLTSISGGEEQASTLDEVVALGFLACVKALRETSLLQEVAIREEIQQIHDLGADVVNAIQRTEARVRRDLQLVHGARAEPG